MKRRLKKASLKPIDIVNICRDKFNVEIKVENILLNSAFTGNSSYTSVFKNDRNEIFALCLCDGALTLADVNGIIKKMGMKPERVYPPGGDEQYFVYYAKKTYESVFPGRKCLAEQDAVFYKSFAPYSPALIRIKEISGEIKHFDTSWNKWTSAINFSYYRVKVG